MTDSCAPWIGSQVTPPVRPRVIVADDHLDVRASAASILAPSCDVVALVPDGVSAVEAAVRLHPDVVIVDVMMAPLDGFQACRRILSSRGGARVVLMSSYAGDSLVLEGLVSGAS